MPKAIPLPSPMVGSRPVVTTFDGITVVRDDLLQAGTKQLALLKVLPSYGAKEFVYTSPVYGYAQVALAFACRELGYAATIFCAERKSLHPLTARAAAYGARIVQVPVGRLSLLKCRAREYCLQTGARLFPMGFDLPEIRAVFVERAKSVDFAPKEVWCAAGSGCLSKSLQEAWPDARHFAIRIGFEPSIGGATCLTAPEKFQDPAKILPPFPSCINYDAKCWRFVRERAGQPGVLFWNVAA